MSTTSSGDGSDDSKGRPAATSGMNWRSNCASIASACADGGGGRGIPASSMWAARSAEQCCWRAICATSFANPGKQPNNDHLILFEGPCLAAALLVSKAAGTISDDEFMTLRKRGSRLEGRSTPVITLGGYGDWLVRAGPAADQHQHCGLAGKYLDKLPLPVYSGRPRR